MFLENPAGENVFPSSRNAFLNKSFIPATKKGFSSNWKPPTLLESFFLLMETVTDRVETRTYS